MTGCWRAVASGPHKPQCMSGISDLHGSRLVARRRFKHVNMGDGSVWPRLRRAAEMALDCARGMLYLLARKCARAAGLWPPSMMCRSAAGLAAYAEWWRRCIRLAR